MPKGISRYQNYSQPAATHAVEWRSPYTPYPEQLEFHKHKARFRVLAFGRRGGKSKSSIVETFECLRDSLRVIPEGRIPRAWVVAPTFNLVEEDWRIAIEIFGPILVERNIAKMSMMLPLGNGRIGEIEFKSAERKDEGLRGAGIVFALLDEAARIPKEAWEYGVRPALADFRGRAVFISTPRGRNWFYELWKKGQVKEGEVGYDPDWKSWQFPASINPYFPKEEWESIQATTPSLLWKQEYLAEFLENEGVVFGGLSKVAGGDLSDPKEGRRYSHGWDLARSLDFTVGITMDDTGQVVRVHRSKELDWSLQKKLIQANWMKYQPGKTWIDSSGVGDAIESDLRRVEMSLEGVKTQSALVKTELIEHLIVCIENGSIQIPSEKDTPGLNWLWEELRSFERVDLGTGNYRYCAPEGKHDDGVIALALAAWGLRSVLGRKVRLEEQPSRWTSWRDYQSLQKQPLYQAGGVTVRPGIIARPW